jgi:hypothetical protein
MHDISAYFRTRRLLSWFIGLVILALLAAMVYLAALPFLAYFPFTDLPNLLDKPKSYQDYGAWLAGALTPLLAIIALVSWWFQKSGQDKANQIQGQTLVLTNVHELYGGLNYMAWCAIGARHPEPGKVVQQGNLQEVERLTWLLRNRGSEKVVVGTRSNGGSL